MVMEEIFKNRSVNFEKLKNFGFKQTERGFIFRKDILGGDFDVVVEISKKGEVSTKVFDKGSGEQYVLHLMKDAVGEFVGSVRAEYEQLLQQICDSCFERDAFKCEQSKEIIEYIRQKYGDELEYLWEKLPNAAIWRRKDTRKWYGVMMVMLKKKLGLKSDELVDVLDLHTDPDLKVVNGKTIFEGYHMNKKYWITICLDYSVPTEKIKEYIDLSYKLAKK